MFPFLCSYIFATLEFDSNYLVSFLWNIVKLPDHSEVKPPIGKIFWKYKPIRHYLVMSSKIIVVLLCKQVYDSCNKVSYLQKNKKSYNWETTFQKKVNLPEVIKNFSNLCPCGFNCFCLFSAKHSIHLRLLYNQSWFTTAIGVKDALYPENKNQMCITQNFYWH